MKLYCINFILLCFFLSPLKGFACEKQAVESCRSKSIETESSEKYCCTEESHKTESNNCGGKCGHSNCTSISPTFQSILTFFDILFKNNVAVKIAKKSTFHHSESFISDGFSTIWSPPNIK